MARNSSQVIATEIVRSGKHVFIEASAGAGKTTQLVEILYEAIAGGFAEIGEILCVTFTEKAASELKARIYARLRQNVTPATQRALADFTRNQIGTIHEFCLRQLRESPRASLMDNSGAIISEIEVFDEAREWVYRTVWPVLGSARLERLLEACEFGSGGSNRSFDNAMKSRALFLYANPDALLWPPAPPEIEIDSPDSFRSYTLKKIVERMHAITRERGLITFAGMITAFAEESQNAQFAQKIRSAYKFALIDEFQDTDQTQWKIFRTLFLTAEADRRQLIVVGDPKQAIYKFRGADVFVYLHARTELLNAGALRFTLNTNFRSAPELLGVQDAIFTDEQVAASWQSLEFPYTPPGYGEITRSTGDDNTGAEFYVQEKYSKTNEFLFLSAAITRLQKIRATHPEWSVAIIAHRHAVLVEAADILRQHRIPYAYYKQRPDFQSLEVDHLRILLDALALPYDEGLLLAENTIFLKGQQNPAEYFARLLQLAARGRILTLLIVLGGNQSPLHLLLEREADAPRYHRWRVLFQTLLDACGKSIFDLVTLQKALFTFAEDSHGEDLKGDMLSAAGAVTLLTVQSAKGLDWNVVVLADGIHDKFANDFAFFHDREKRGIIPADVDAFDSWEGKLMQSRDETQITQLNLLYVALTRAKHKLIAGIWPPYGSMEPGPVARFLPDWLSRQGNIRGMTICPLPVSANVPALPATRTKKPPDIVHADIPQRVSERTSFTALSSAEFTETAFADDILPRGAATGQLLHNLLETCNFSAFEKSVEGHLDAMRTATRKSVTELFSEKIDSAAVTERILEIVQACATAKLPLSMAQRGFTSLAALPPDNLWREMPFWSSAEIHRVLRNETTSRVQKTMHGFMDLVFTTDGTHYYLLDYKSNSLSDVEPENIAQYTQSHYGLQAEIYAEALGAYLAAAYPHSQARVAGCYFLYLRYLKPGETTGVYFKDFHAD